jgi:hypothetical protein
VSAATQRLPVPTRQGRVQEGAASPILPLHLRPALLAGIAIVDRAGPEMLQMLHGHMMGENKARFGSAIDEIMYCARQSPASSQLHLI